MISAYKTALVGLVLAMAFGANAGGTTAQSPESQVEPIRAYRVDFRDTLFTVCEVDLTQCQLRLFWRDENKQDFRTLRGLRSYLESQGENLLLATNAGIYTTAFKPLGLHVEEGKQLMRLNRGRGGRGNFTLLPNGVFYVRTDGKPGILETEAFAAAAPSVRLATQSGPLLVLDGALHPKFQEGSDSKYYRSGVGVLDNDTVVFAISNAPVNLYDFGLFFLEQLRCRNALYLDGTISQMYLPALGRNELGGPFVGILAVTQPNTAAVAQSTGDIIKKAPQAAE